MLGNEVFQVGFQPTSGKIQVSPPESRTDTEGVGIYFASKLKEATSEVQMMRMGSDGWWRGYKLQDNLDNSIRQHKKSSQTPTAKRKNTYSK